MGETLTNAAPYLLLLLGLAAVEGLMVIAVQRGRGQPSDLTETEAGTLTISGAVKMDMTPRFPESWYTTPANRAWFPHPPQKIRIFVDGHDIEEWPDSVLFPNLGEANMAKVNVEEMDTFKATIEWRIRGLLRWTR